MTNLRWYTWTIYLCIAKVQMNMRHTFTECLLDFVNINSRKNIANVSLHIHMSSILNMWLVLVSYVLTLIKFRL